MAVAWILVANASEAKIFAHTGIAKGLNTITTLSHSESRRKSADLVTDRPGHMQGSGNGHGSRQPATDPKQHEHTLFARELVQKLDQGRTSNSFQRLIIVAEPHFCGLLKGAMSNQIGAMVSDTINKDYTKLTDKELCGHLEKVIYV
ncbi:MAG: host attachment protein [Sulfuricella sp.]|nr:host attachment protein [Sulfuricella sp.]